MQAMRKSIHAVLPALALLALGGCAGTSALTTTESDGIYYSSKDRTIMPASVPTASTIPYTGETTTPGDVTNPDYVEGSTANSAASTEYYDDDYGYASRLRRFHSPYQGLGLGYYDFAYTDPFWYGGPAYAMYPGAYSPWGYGGGYGYGYRSFYDPFYSPYWGGSMISINIGRPWYRPWGYGGYGYGYNPYDYYGGYGGFGYGGGGYYNGFGPGYYNGGSVRSRVVYGPRRDGATNATNITSNATGGRGRGRVEQGGIVQPGGVNGTGLSTDGAVATPAPQPARGRGRNRTLDPTTTSGVTSSGIAVDNPSQPNPNSTPGGRRWQVLDQAGAATGSQPTTAPADYSQPRRGRGSMGSAGQSGQQSGTYQPTRRRAVADQPVRTYEQPTRTYEQPARSYEQPSRSYSSPSSGGNFGGSSGGGGGARGRGRVQ